MDLIGLKLDRNGNVLGIAVKGEKGKISFIPVKGDGLVKSLALALKIGLENKGILSEYSFLSE